MIKSKYYSKRRNVYPVSYIREFCTSGNHLEAIAQLILLDNKKLRSKIIKFIKSYFIPSTGGSKYPREKLKPLVDILMVTLDEETGEEALGLIYNIQRVSENYNSDLDFAVFSLADRELISTNDKIKDSILLRYLTVPFVKRVIENASKSEILNTFMAECIQEATLIWGKEMRELLNAVLEEHLKEFKTELIIFVKNKTLNFRKVKNMPVYSNSYSKVIKYPQVEHEIRCAEYYLRIWNKNKEKLEKVNKTRFFNNLPNTFEEITSTFPDINLDNLQIVIKSYSISYADSGDNKKLSFPFFDTTLKIAELLCTSLTTSNQLHIKRIFKFVYQIVLSAAEGRFGSRTTSRASRGAKE